MTYRRLSRLDERTRVRDAAIFQPRSGCIVETAKLRNSAVKIASVSIPSIVRSRRELLRFTLRLRRDHDFPGLSYGSLYIAPCGEDQFCNLETTLCAELKHLDEPCSTDSECYSNRCSADGKCVALLECEKSAEP
jgi:hypothetical protein